MTIYGAEVGYIPPHFFEQAGDAVAHRGGLLVPYIKATSKNVRVLSEFCLPWFDESAVVALNYHLDF